MKFKKILALFLLSGIIALPSCGGADNTETKPESSTSETESESSSTSEGISTVDYVHDGTVSLGLDYHGKTFANDGIEQVNVRKSGDAYIGFIDGDTAHFTPKSGGELIKARFYGIDTPESTGKVQPWGKEASNYTKEKLKEADENGTIVLSSPQETYGIPSPDSTGTRYVSLVWINPTVKNAPIESLYLLNLMIVQDGYSWVKNVDDIPSYRDTFYAAQDQARALGLNLFSGTIPDTFNNGGYEETSIGDLRDEFVECIKDPNHKNAYDNRRVRIYGTVAGFSNKILYLQDYIKEYNEDGTETGEGHYAGINIFVGAASIASKFTKLGTYISVAGLAQDSENFGFQITDTNFPRVSYDAEKDAQVIYTAEQNFDHALVSTKFSAAELNNAILNKNFEALFCNVEITEPLTVTGGYTGESGTQVTLQFGKDIKFSVFVTFTLYPNPDDPAEAWNTIENYMGHKVKVKGVFVARKTASGNWQYQINPSNGGDIEVVE